MIYAKKTTDPVQFAILCFVRSRDKLQVATDLRWDAHDYAQECEAKGFDAQTLRIARLTLTGAERAQAADEESYQRACRFAAIIRRGQPAVDALRRRMADSAFHAIMELEAMALCHEQGVSPESSLDDLETRLLDTAAVAGVAS